jgi:hypothetical protein
MILNAATIRAQARKAYAEIEALGEPVMIHERTPAGFVDHGPVKAFVASFRRDDLIPGGPIEQGDLKATFNRKTWPAALTRRLGRGDRVTWRGELYAVIDQDDATRSAVGEQFGLDLQLRGGAG